MLLPPYTSKTFVPYVAVTVPTCCVVPSPKIIRVGLWNENGSIVMPPKIFY